MTPTTVDQPQKQDGPTPLSFNLPEDRLATLTDALTPTRFIAATRLNGEQRTVVITRHDNHGHVIPNGAWAACIGEMYACAMAASLTDRYENPAGSWVWAYKLYTAFATPQDALAAARSAASMRLNAERRAANGITD